MARVPRREPTGFWSRVFIGAFLVTGAVLCYFLARNITTPVVQLRALASRFSRGDFSARMTLRNVLYRRDEIGALARDFNLMASRIEELVSAQQRLIADVSHELRSPITRLRLALGLVRRRNDADPGLSLARMEREVERLDTLIGQLLTLWRLESLSQPPQMETLDLSALVKEFLRMPVSRRRAWIATYSCSMRGMPDSRRNRSDPQRG